ncbi:MAG: ester cyclase [Chloroflexota bacterium]|nr:ester cyclase [Chloroflexota bacterium]
MTVERSGSLSTDRNKALYLQYQQALFHPDTLMEFLAEGFVAHDLPPGASLPGWRKQVMNVFPDQQSEVLHMTAEGALVSGHLRVSGTHRAAFRGIPPTGKIISFELFDVARFDDDGKIAERWALVDWMSVYRQMGITEIPQA